MMTLRVRRLPSVVGVILFTSVLGGCGANDGFSPMNFIRARERWESHRPVAYRFVISVSCECFQDGPVLVEVDGDVVKKRVLVETGQIFPEGQGDAYPSIDGLFEMVEQSRRTGADRIEVHYDNDLGYPRSIGIDHDRHTVDDEVSYSIRNFEPLAAR